MDSKDIRKSKRVIGKLESQNVAKNQVAATPTTKTFPSSAPTERRSVGSLITMDSNSSSEFLILQSGSGPCSSASGSSTIPMASKSNVSTGLSSPNVVPNGSSACPSTSKITKKRKPSKAPLASTSKLSTEVSSPSIASNISSSVAGPSTSKKRKSTKQSGSSGSAKKKAGKGIEATGSQGKGGTGTENRVYQFKVTLKGSKPPIWRRILMPEDATFFDLHQAIQGFMGWRDAHIHEFKFSKQGLRLGCDSESDEDSDDEDEDSDSDEDSDEDEEPAQAFNRGLFGMFGGLFGGSGIPGYFEKVKQTKCEKDINISGPFQIEKRCSYVYDFGDNWDHDVLLEKILPAEEDEDYPKCVTGKRACPPEDCGGVNGFQELVNIWKKPKEERTSEEQEQLEWGNMLDEGYDPDKYVPSDNGRCVMS